MRQMRRLELAHGRDREALAAFRAAERLADRLAPSHPLVARDRAWLLYTLVRLGDTERAEQALSGLGVHDSDRAEARIAASALRLARDNPDAAAAALAPVLDGSVSEIPRMWLALAFLLGAIALDALGDPDAAGNALERALDLAEPDGALTPFLLHPVPGLLERHARHRTAHAALAAEIRGLLAGTRAGPQHGAPPPPSRPEPLLEPLSGSEVRVLRYLPTNLSAPEIARELSPSVRKHMCLGQPSRVPGGSIPAVDRTPAVRKMGGKCSRSSAAPMAVCLCGYIRRVMRIYPARGVGSGVVPVGARNWGGGWRAGAGADEGSAVMRGRVTEDERARDEGTGGGRRRRRWSLPANATRTRTRRRGGRRRRWAARFRRSAGSPCGG